MLAVALAACDPAAVELGDAAPLDGDAHELTALERVWAGPGVDLPDAGAIRGRLPLLEGSLSERRAHGWNLAAQALEPVPVAGHATAKVPRFQGWYSRDEVLAMLQEGLRRLPKARLLARAPFSEAELDALFAWNATRATTLPSFSLDAQQKLAAHLSTAGGRRSLGGGTRTLMSPAFVRHLLREYPGLLRCAETPSLGTVTATPSSPTNFTSCFRTEFPPEAAVVKLRWVPTTERIPAFDLSPAGLAKALTDGTWSTERELSPTVSRIYTATLASKDRLRLAGVHVMRKDLRDWSWASLFWSETPALDLGADKTPAYRKLAAVWQNYQLCAVTGFEEHAPVATAHPQTQAALQAALGASSWCSNPYLEVEVKAARTNCLGCHQHGGELLTNDEILARPFEGRPKVRETFPADYSWVTSGVLDLGPASLATWESLAAF